MYTYVYTNIKPVSNFRKGPRNENKNNNSQKNKKLPTK